MPFRQLSVDVLLFLLAIPGFVPLPPAREQVSLAVLALTHHPAYPNNSVRAVFQ